MDAIETLKKRGLFEAITSDEMKLEKPTKIYAGFDPTADSLHLGNFVAMMGLAHFQALGHTPVALIGGATGLIGDPSGKSHERPLIDEETLKRNCLGIEKDLRALLCRSGLPEPIIVNNNDWIGQMSYVEFLRDIGKHMRMGSMLAKESVKSRLNSEEGMSFTEFCYQTIQAYDFYHLFKEYGVTVQLGGSDQWGNITAGIEFVRKQTGKAVHGITFPLLTRSDGKKFGKTESGAIWLSSEKLSPYDFYQYLYRLPDADVIKMMKRLTFMTLKEIAPFEEGNLAPNMAQKRLAEVLTELVHGEVGLEKARATTNLARPGKETKLTSEVLEKLSSEIPTFEVSFDKTFIELLAETQIAKSKGEARRLIRGGGVSINNAKWDDENGQIPADLPIGGTYLLVAVGKKKKFLLKKLA